jgi:hypothetical protein
MMLLVLGIVLGNTISSYQATQAQAPAVSLSNDDLVKLVGELKGIGSDVKDISTRQIGP